MPVYKFAVGDRVEFLPNATDYHVPRVVYTVVRRLPFQGRMCSYRVKSTADGHERVIQEDQLGRIAQTDQRRSFTRPVG